jgi:hypothetical protein
LLRRMYGHEVRPEQLRRVRDEVSTGPSVPRSEVPLRLRRARRRYFGASTLRATDPSGCLYQPGSS